MPYYYVVKRGRTIGIFPDWETTSKSVDGFSGAIHQKFTSYERAFEFLHSNDDPKPEARLVLKPVIKAPIADTNHLMIYTDGSYEDSVGGYSNVRVENGTVVKTKHGRVPIYPCTSQKAELYAIKEALSNNPETELLIRTDSVYSIGCFTSWHQNWLRNGWKTSSGKPVENRTLIEQVLNLMKNRNIKFEHVKSHNGEKFNELADELAKQGRLGL